MKKSIQDFNFQTLKLNSEFDWADKKIERDSKSNLIGQVNFAFSYAESEN